MGSYASLNLSYNVGDEKGRVDSNRLALAEAAGVPLSRWILPRQVHGAASALVGLLEAGRGSRDFLSGIPRTDALVTRTTGLALAVLTADCVPLIMVDLTRRMVGVVHAGWRGVYAGTPAAAYSMLTEGGGEGGQVLVFIGPHIRSCCMEVGEELKEAFERKYGVGVVPTSDTGAPHLDLETACVLQLGALGVPRSDIFTTGECTACSQGYFSYRNSGGRCGRQGALTAMTG